MLKIGLLCLLWACLLAGPAEGKSNGEQCLLAMRLHPLEFVEKTSTVQFKIRFDSNCMPYFQMQYFIIPWKLFYDLSLESHPTQVVVEMMDTEYTLLFSEPVAEPDGPFKVLKYQTARVSPSHFESIPIRVSSSNYFAIQPEGTKHFTKERVAEFWRAVNPSLCSVEEGMKKLICGIKQPAGSRPKGV